MPIVEYKCKHCLHVYKHRRDAVNCEKTHLPVTSAKARQYIFGPYPLYIDVTFPDGKTELYTRDADTFTIYRKD